MVIDFKFIIDRLAHIAKEDAIEFFITYNFKFLYPNRDPDPKQSRILAERLMEDIVTERMKKESASLIELLVSFFNQYLDEIQDDLKIWSVVTDWDAEKWKKWEGESKYQWGWIAHDLYLLHKVLLNFGAILGSTKDGKTLSITPDEFFISIMAVFFYLDNFAAFCGGLWGRKTISKAYSSKGGKHPKSRQGIKEWIRDYFGKFPNSTVPVAMKTFAKYQQAAPHKFGEWHFYHFADENGDDQFCQIAENGKHECIRRKRFEAYCAEVAPKGRRQKMPK